MAGRWCEAASSPRFIVAPSTPPHRPVMHPSAKTECVCIYANGRAPALRPSAHIGHYPPSNLARCARQPSCRFIGILPNNANHRHRSDSPCKRPACETSHNRLRLATRCEVQVPHACQGQATNNEATRLTQSTKQPRPPSGTAPATLALANSHDGCMVGGRTACVATRRHGRSGGRLRPSAERLATCATATAQEPSGFPPHGWRRTL